MPGQRARVRVCQDDSAGRGSASRRRSGADPLKIPQAARNGQLFEQIGGDLCMLGRQPRRSPEATATRRPETSLGALRNGSRWLSQTNIKTDAVGIDIPEPRPSSSSITVPAARRATNCCWRWSTPTGGIPAARSSSRPTWSWPSRRSPRRLPGASSRGRRWWSSFPISWRRGGTGTEDIPRLAAEAAGRISWRAVFGGGAVGPPSADAGGHRPADWRGPRAPAARASVRRVCRSR